MDLVGIEPTTSSMPWKRAPKLRHRPTPAGNSSILFGCNRFVKLREERLREERQKPWRASDRWTGHCRGVQVARLFDWCGQEENIDKHGYAYKTRDQPAKRDFVFGHQRPQEDDQGHAYGDVD